jgi:hypothetical protein
MTRATDALMDKQGALWGHSSYLRSERSWRSISPAFHLRQRREERETGNQSVLHLCGLDGVGAPAPSCGGGLGRGVARTQEIVEFTSAGSSRRTVRPPSLFLPHKRGRRRI